MRYSSLHQTPQTAALPGQVPNNAGGYAYALDKSQRLERFLILGSDSNTYYQNAPALTRENAQVVIECWTEDAGKTLARIINISEEGRAPKNDAAIFAVALGCVHADLKVRHAAYSAISRVCRTSTHVYQLVDNARSLGKGFGRGFKRAIANWYDSKSVDDVAFQAVKYRQREGWSHKRLLDLSHPSGDKSRDALYSWIVGKPVLTENLPAITQDFINGQALQTALSQASASVNKKMVLDLATRLPWEALPTEWLNDKAVWEALLPKMGLTALVRNLAKMTSIGVLAPFSPSLKIVKEKLADADYIKKSRLHPFAILQAMGVYAQGHGVKGSLSWQPVPDVIYALGEAFYKAFVNVTPSGKHTLIALDVSGSMGHPLSGSVVSCRAASAAMALVTLAVEPETHIIGFHAEGAARGYYGGYPAGPGVSPLSISKGQRLDDVVRYTDGLAFGPTDCSLPALYAARENLDVEGIVIYTDNETYAGKIHSSVALEQLRRKLGHDVKQVVVGMTSTGFTIADRNDVSSLDVVGFDTAAPALISDFIRG